MRYFIKSKIKQPGKRGGKYWIDKKGEIQYGEKPGERQPRQIDQAKPSRRPIDVSEFKKHGIPQDARHAYQYESHEKYTHEWRDSKGRLQRRYKPEFVAAKQSEKYKRISNAINRLPELREAVNNDLNGKNVQKKFTALAIRIMDLTGARVGNEKYTDENETHGITTLEKDHCIFQDDKAILGYIGKKGIHQTHEIDQPEVVAALRELKQMPGKRLFQIDDKGNVSSDGVNKYLKIYGLDRKGFENLQGQC